MIQFKSRIKTIAKKTIIQTIAQNLQKIAAVLIRSMFTIKACKEVYIPLATKNNLPVTLNTIPLKHMLYIEYLVLFKKD